MKRSFYDLDDVLRAVGIEWHGTLAEFQDAIAKVARRAGADSMQRDMLRREAALWLMRELGEAELVAREAAARGVLL